jgi:DNA-binding NtrC family response regulator
MAVERFDIILSDVRMPGIDGVAFLKEIKTLCPDTLTVLMSGCMADRGDEALRHGAWAFLEKPFEIDDLIALLQRAIRDCTLVRDLRAANKQSILSHPVKHS